jgi:hypothetical protein
VNNPHDVKENYEHALDSAFHFLLRGLFCLRVIAINPVLVNSVNLEQEGCIVGGNLTKLLIDIDTMLLQISCQKSHQARYMILNKRM